MMLSVTKVEFSLYLSIDLSIGKLKLFISSKRNPH